MPTSPAFIRIKANVLKIVVAIPARKLCTFHSIGEHLDVMPRHVAYILSQLSAEEKMLYPWYRVVADHGRLATIKYHADGRSQADCIRDEGLIVRANAVAQFEKCFVAAAEVKSGAAKQVRGALHTTDEERKK